MTDGIEHGSNEAGLTDAGARRLLFGSLIFSVAVGLAWGWWLYPSFEDMRIFNVVGLVVITVVFLVASFVGIRAWRQGRRS